MKFIQKYSAIVLIIVIVFALIMVYHRDVIDYGQWRSDEVATVRYIELANKEVALVFLDIKNNGVFAVKMPITQAIRYQKDDHVKVSRYKRVLSQQQFFLMKDKSS